MLIILVFKILKDLLYYSVNGLPFCISSSGIFKYEFEFILSISIGVGKVYFFILFLNKVLKYSFFSKYFFSKSEKLLKSVVEESQ